MSFAQGKVYCFHKKPTYSKRFMSWAEISRDVECGSQGRILGHVAQPYAMPLAPSFLYSHLPHHSPLSFPRKLPFSRGSRPSREPQWGGCVLMLLPLLPPLSGAPSPHAHVGRKSSETGVPQELKEDLGQHYLQRLVPTARWWWNHWSQPVLPLLRSLLLMLGPSLCEGGSPFPAGSWLGSAWQGCHREYEGWREMEDFSFVCFPFLSALPQQHFFSPPRWLPVPAAQVTLDCGGSTPRTKLIEPPVKSSARRWFHLLWGQNPSSKEPLLQTPSSKLWVPFWACLFHRGLHPSSAGSF